VKKLYPRYAALARSDPKVGKALFEFDQARLELATTVDVLDERISDAEDSHRRGYFSEGEFKEELDQIRSAMQGRAAAAQQKVERAGRELVETAKGATAKADPADLERVRQLLREGVTADTILTQARERRDVGTVAALASEAAWHNVDGRLVEGMEEWERSARQAYAELAGDDGKLIGLGLEVEDAVEQLQPITEFTMKTVHGAGDRASDRIALGHALGDDPYGRGFDPASDDPIDAAAGGAS
jgi:hypothetical protein